MEVGRVSVLSVVVRTDMRRGFETDGKKYIDLNLGIDDRMGSFERSAINVRLNIPSDTGNPTLWVNGIKTCEIIHDKAHCPGPYGLTWKWDE